MNTNLIWDVDGTLIDSYDSIIDSINKTIEQYGISYERDYIRNVIQSTSTGTFLEEIADRNNLNATNKSY